MKRNIISILAFTLFAPTASIAKDMEPTSSCLETLQQLSPGISKNLECVFEKSSESFLLLCRENGIGITEDLQRFLVRKAKYEEAISLADVYLKAHPGASHIPMSIAAKIENAELDWLVAGKRNAIENHIEQVRKQSSSCK